MDKLVRLLKLFAAAGGLNDCWREAGFASAGEAAGALLELARSVGAARGEDGAERRGGLSVVVYVDGASRGNPGPSAVGATVYTAQGDELYSRRKEDRRGDEQRRRVPRGDRGARSSRASSGERGARSASTASS